MQVNLNVDLRLFEALSDRDVVQRVLAGDLALFELLMRRYNRRLFRYSRGILNDDMLAQDAVQEAYLNAFQHLDQFRGPHGFGAWLMRITARTSIRIGQKESRFRVLGADIEPDSLLSEDSNGPERAVINAEVVGTFEKAIDKLPRDFRVTFILRELEGMSIQETANILDVNPTTVKTRLHRARSILRTRFKHRLEEFHSLAYAFAGERCDAIVEQVFSALALIINEEGGIS